MRILLIGGNGLIGAHIAAALRARGHTPTSVSRTSDPGVDLKSASLDDLRRVSSGHDGVILAVRTEEQRPLPKPVYPRFRSDMVDPVVRLFTAARLEGLTRGVILGSYYTYFDRLHPSWRLAERSAYVRCRVEQAREGREAAGMPVAVLELPFVVGRSGPRQPNWAGPLDRWARSRAPLFMPTGGTAVTAATSVAEAAVDALEQAAGDDIPLADENLTWHDMLTRITAAMGRRRPIHRLPSAPLRTTLRGGSFLQSLARKETGVDPACFADLILTNLFIEPASGRSLQAAFSSCFAATH